MSENEGRTLERAQALALQTYLLSIFRQYTMTHPDCVTITWNREEAEAVLHVGSEFFATVARLPARRRATYENTPYYQALKVLERILKPEPCHDCDGTGEHVINPAWPSGIEPYSEKCPTCSGTGEEPS